MKKNFLRFLSTTLLVLLVFNVNQFAQDTHNDYAFYSSPSGACFRIAHSPAIDITGDFTLEAWVFIDENTPSSRFIIDRAGVCQFYIISASVRFDLNPGTLISTGELTLNEWHHVAVVREGTRTLIYADGVKKQADDIALIANPEPIYVGGQAGWFSGARTSLFDELRFSNAAVYDTSGFVPDTTQALGSNPSTVFYFQFEDNTEFPPMDDSPNSLVTENGKPAGTNLVTVDSYIPAPEGIPLPVELTSFAAVANGSSVTLSWETASEINNSGFEVERAVDSKNYEKISFVNGAGSSTEKNSYSFTDNVNAAGKVSYRLKQLDFDGTFKYSNSVEVTVGEVSSFNLAQNYPNPFNPSTTIEFQIPEASNVSIKVYNMIGEVVAEILNENLEAGFHTAIFDAASAGRSLTSGVYLYRIEAGSFTKTMKMTLLK